jgi:hypothetical protein
MNLIASKMNCLLLGYISVYLKIQEAVRQQHAINNAQLTTDHWPFL